MDRFLELNKQKIAFAFKRTSIIFLILALILLTFAYCKTQLPDKFLIATILLTAALVFPILIIFIAYLEWLSKRRVRKKAFSKPPFNELDKIGFSKSYINEKARWYFTEESKAGIINEFKVKCDVTRGNSKTIQFKALIKHKHIEKDDFKKLEKLYKTQNIVFDFDGLIKMYSLKRLTIHSIQQLESDLVKFTELLKKENFEPEK